MQVIVRSYQSESEDDESNHQIIEDSVSTNIEIQSASKTLV